VPVNLRDLEARFEAGDEVTLEALIEKGLIKNSKTDVKILGTGELTKKLAVSAHGFSKTAREKIEAAGGSITWLRGEPAPPKAKKAVPKPKAEEAEPEEAPAPEPDAETEE
jgi:large subunit ribosomal protein L15